MKILIFLPWLSSILPRNKTPNPIARTSSTKKIQPPFSIIFYLNEIHQSLSLEKINLSYFRTEVGQEPAPRPFFDPRLQQVEHLGLIKVNNNFVIF